MKIDNLNLKKLRANFKQIRKATNGFKKLLVRDPLDFLDYEVEIKKNLKDLVSRINSGNYRPSRPYMHESAKGKGINRSTVVLDIEDFLIYRFCIEQIEDELLRGKQKNIRGGTKIKAIKTPRGEFEYERFFEDWLNFIKDIENSLKGKKYLVITDIASYFENINILLLKDLVRSKVQDKVDLINLLFYILEDAIIRSNYETNSYNGLPQENYDCSRILAYFFLMSLDKDLKNFCKEYGAEYYRFLDDMTIIVKRETEGRRALNVLTNSLRRLGLVASIEKTTILSTESAKKELFIKENRVLDRLGDRLIHRIKNKQKLDPVLIKIKDLYREKSKLENRKNYRKFLKRFYTIFGYAECDYLLNKIEEHLIKYPDILMNKKLLKYLARNQKRTKKFNNCLEKIINYLYSDENLYPALESYLVEMFIYFNKECLSKNVQKKIKKLCTDIFLGKNYNVQSEYVRAISCLLWHRFNRQNIEELANYYLESSEKDDILKKYLIFVSLTSKNCDLRTNVLNKARKEQARNINRLVNFIDNIDEYKNSKEIKNYLRDKKLGIYFKRGDTLRIDFQYKSVRSEILEEIINIYKSNKIKK